MAIIKCRYCGQKLNVRPGAVGLCPRCGTEIEVPEDDEYEEIQTTSHYEEPPKSKKKVVAILSLLGLLATGIFLAIRAQIIIIDFSPVIVRQIRSTMSEYEQIKEDLETLNVSNYEQEIEPVEKILTQIDALDASKNPDLKEYLKQVKSFSTEIREIIENGRKVRLDYEGGQSGESSSGVNLILANLTQEIKLLMDQALAVSLPEEYQ